MASRREPILTWSQQIWGKTQNSRLHPLTSLLLTRLPISACVVSAVHSVNIKPELTGGYFTLVETLEVFTLHLNAV
jgi:hypothetical protein